MKNSRLLIAFYVCVLVLFTATAKAALFVPSGLAPGESYQLVFVTSGTTFATSGDINYYNAFVQAAADAAGIGSSEGVIWSAIASTATIDANANALVNTKVFNLGGELVATGYADFWDCTHAVGVGIDFDENSNARNFNVWTGSNTDGTKAVGLALGDTSARWGESTFANFGWIAQGATTTADHGFSLYALSGPLTAPVPVPAALWLFGSGLFGLIGIARKKAA